MTRLANDGSYRSVFTDAPAPETCRDAYLASCGLKPCKIRSGFDFHRLRHMTPVKQCAEMLYWHGGSHHVPGNDREILARAFSGGAVGDIFRNIFEAAAIEGTEAAIDTTLGWTTDVSVSNFQPRPAFVLRQGGRLELLAKGATAASGDMVVSGQEWQIKRYAMTFKIDEQDLHNDYAGVLPLLIKQQATAASLMRPDLVYSLILKNPNIVDFSQTEDTPLFSASHGNYATTGSALSNTTLQAGLTAIGNQHHHDAKGNPLHISQRGHYLIVPHEQTYTARHLAREMSLGDDDDLEVIPESRLGPVGLVDPASGELRTQYTGSTSNWLLAARPTITPSIIVGYLAGTKTPRIRQESLLPGSGEWGIGIDINLDIGVTAVDFRQLYFATGAA